MVEILQDFPSDVAAFKATGTVTGKDYDEVINPRVAQLYNKNGKIRYFYQIDTPLSNFTAEAWLKDAMIGFVYLTEFKKIAIVSEKAGIKKFTNIFGKFLPGQYRGFMEDEFEEAKGWISE